MRVGLGIGLSAFSGGLATPGSLSQFNNVQLWLEAFDPATITQVTSGTTRVSVINDKSGKGNHAAEATHSQRPTLVGSCPNGANALRFSGGQDLIIPNASGLAPTSAMSLFVVWAFTGGTFGGGFQSIIMHTIDAGWGDGWGLHNGPVGTNGLHEFRVGPYNTTYAQLGSHADNNFRATAHVFDKTVTVPSNLSTLKNFTDGVADGVGTSPRTTDINYSTGSEQTVLAAYTTAGGTGAVTGFSVCDIAMVVMASYPFTANDIDILHKYAKAKCGTP